MFEEKLNELYVKIAQHISDMIPTDWKEIYFEGRVVEGSGTTYFYFNTAQDENNFHYSLSIPDEFGVNKATFKQLSFKLFKLMKELKELFIKNDQEPWFSIIMYMNDEGKFEIKYNYINWYEGDFVPTDLVEYFKYKYLSIHPEDQED